MHAVVQDATRSKAEKQDRTCQAERCLWKGPGPLHAGPCFAVIDDGVDEAKNKKQLADVVNADLCKQKTLAHAE